MTAKQQTLLKPLSWALAHAHFFPMHGAEVRGPGEGAAGLPDAGVQAACELWHNDHVDT